MLATNALVFASGMLAVAYLAYRSLAWSLDSPVLRRALRKRRRNRTTRFGMVAVSLASALTVGWLGAWKLSAATLFFSAMLLLFANAAVLFCGLVAEDVRETFLRLAAKHFENASFVGWNRPVKRSISEPQNCRPRRTCSEQPRPCDSGVVSHSRRGTDRPRSRQHR